MAKVYVGIGSNLGDRAAHVAAAVARMNALPETKVLGVSSVIETDPVGPAGRGKFLNAAAELETELAPAALLADLQGIERDLGRVRAERWGPRTIDLDILLYDDRVVDAPALTVPHPRMCERAFVLGPLAELAPDLVHPVERRPVRELLDALRGGG